MRRSVPWLFVLLVGALQSPAPHLMPGDAWIVMDGDVDAAMDHAEAAGLPVYRLPHLDMGIVGADGPSISLLQATYGLHAVPDWTEDLHLDESVPFISAPPVKQMVGDARDGPSVLVVDTGVSDLHPDFQAGNLAANIRPESTGSVIDALLSNVPVIDPSGHGTHVAGIVAGSGAGLGPLTSENYAGVYSNGRIIGFQAAQDNDGEIVVSGQAILAAFDWALEHQDEYDIRVLSNSWGSAGALDVEDPVERATRALYLHGMTVVFSAGNDGAEGPLNRHCTAPWVLCVAGGDLEGRVGSYSSHGDVSPAWNHPDLTAPGTAIRAPDAVESTDGLLSLASSREALYRDRTGTSMAAPHVSGVAALLVALEPALSPDQVMDILVATTRPMQADPAEAGSGYLDALAAAEQAQRTTGNLDRFLAGSEVKYAGALTGDTANSVDPLTAGIHAPRGRPLAIGEPVWYEAGWVLPAALVAAPVLFALVVVVPLVARRA